MSGGGKGGLRQARALTRSTHSAHQGLNEQTNQAHSMACSCCKILSSPRPGPAMLLDPPPAGYIQNPLWHPDE
eukprot:1159338-Pelagomonas_calceolata.AAC.22